MTTTSPSGDLFKYTFEDFLGPAASAHFKQGVAPQGHINKIHVEYNDPKISNSFWKYLIKDVQKAPNATILQHELIRVHENLRKTGIFKSMGVSFEPDSEKGLLKIIFKPEYEARGFRSFTRSPYGDLWNCFGYHAAIGIRNLTGRLDNLSLNGVYGNHGPLKHSLFVSYKLPIFYKDFSLEVALGKEKNQLNKSLAEYNTWQFIELKRGSISYKLSNSRRENLVNPFFSSPSLITEESTPSNKLSLSASRSWIMLGATQNWFNAFLLRGELASVENAGKFIKCEFGNQHTIVPGFLKSRETGRSLSVENLTSCGFVVPFLKSKLRMNDRFFRTQMKGFSEIVNPETNFDQNMHPLAGKPGYEFLSDHRGDDFFFKHTVKLVFNNCPILEKIKMTPFLYVATGYFHRNRPGIEGIEKSTNNTLNNSYKKITDEMQKKGRLSVGIGLQRTINDSFYMEALVNLFTAGNSSDQFKRFQFRYTLNFD